MQLASLIHHYQPAFEQRRVEISGAVLEGSGARRPDNVGVYGRIGRRLVRQINKVV